MDAVTKTLPVDLVVSLALRPTDRVHVALAILLRTEHNKNKLEL